MIKARRELLKISAITLAQLFVVNDVLADDSWVRMLSGRSGVKKDGKGMTIAESAKRLSEYEKRVVIGILLLTGLKLKNGSINGAGLQDLEERKLDKVIQEGLDLLKRELAIAFPAHAAQVEATT